MPNPTIDKFQVDNTTYDFIDSTARSTANAAVPKTRTVNNKALSSDITLTSEDIGYDSSATYTDGTIGAGVSELKTALTATSNVFEKSTIQSGYTYNNNGNVVQLAVAFLTDYIPVHPNDTVISNLSLGSSYYNHAIFNANLERIALKKSNNDNLTMTMPENAAYIRLTGIAANVDSSYIYVNMAKSVYDIDYLNQNIKPLLSEPLTATLTENGKALRNVAVGELVNTGDEANCCVQRFDVTPNAMYYIKLGFNTSSYIHCFCDANYVILSKVIANRNNQYMIAPPNAKQLCITSALATISEQAVSEVQNMPIEQMKYLTEQTHRNTIYEREVLKYPKWPIDGYSHEAFPSACFWNNNLVVATRLSNSHTAPTEESQWGGMHIRFRNENGAWTDGELYTKSDFTGLNGELRDPQIQPSRDGEHLICAAWTTYKNNDVDVHDNLLVLFDKDMTIENYLVSPLTSALYWGNPLITPDGHLIICGYLNGSTVLLRSAEVFNGDVSALTMETAVTLVSGLSTTEACVGYSDDKLYCLIRRDTDSSKIMWTSNLEGTSGWSEPKNLGMLLHAPKLLPYASGRYIPFGGALYKSSSLRKPIMGYIDTQENEIASYGIVDESIINYSSYLGFVPYGGTDFGVVYYQDTGSGLAGTGLYYKRYNARFNQGKLAYLL